MSPFPGGSAFSMAHDIAGGYQSVTARTFSNMTASELKQIGFELDKRLRETRGEQTPQDEPTFAGAVGAPAHPYSVDVH